MSLIGKSKSPLRIDDENEFAESLKALISKADNQLEQICSQAEPIYDDSGNQILTLYRMCYMRLISVIANNMLHSLPEKSEVNDLLNIRTEDVGKEETLSLLLSNSRFSIYKHGEMCECLGGECHAVWEVGDVIGSINKWEREFAENDANAICENKKWRGQLYNDLIKYVIH